jgi:hypothetical protein
MANLSSKWAPVIDQLQSFVNVCFVVANPLT